METINWSRQHCCNLISIVNLLKYFDNYRNYRDIYFKNFSRTLKNDLKNPTTRAKYPYTVLTEPTHIISMSSTSIFTLQVIIKNREIDITDWHYQTVFFSLEKFSLSLRQAEETAKNRPFTKYEEEHTTTSQHHLGKARTCTQTNTNTYTHTHTSIETEACTTKNFNWNVN